MSYKFINDDFLLQGSAAKVLYHDYARDMPIFDYHSHLPPNEISEDKKYENISRVWLNGDHYKWRAMRSNGVEEKYCTGDVSDYDKFLAWAKTVPYTLRNPLYHWTHLELARYFDIYDLLNGESAKEIYNKTGKMLNSQEYSVKNLLKKMNVAAICTTDDPLDSLENHRKLREEGFKIKVLPTFRPDRGMNVNNIENMNKWIDKLQELTNIDIVSFNSYIEAIKKRHEFFHNQGCRLSDHGIETVYFEEYSESDIKNIFEKIRNKNTLDLLENRKFQSAMLTEFGRMDNERGWTQQIHYGAIRNNNTRLFNQLGPDTGFDSIGDFEIAKSLAKFLNCLETTNELPKTILYNINPRDNEVLATMIGNFQNGSIPGKMQFGSGWWFLDQKDGMEKQMNALSNMGLLSRFVGMLTDSRSFLSFPRHEYFRRILCNLIGRDVDNGELPNDMALLGKMVRGICYTNAVNYFGIEI
ncbi:MAG: glucuronate isomerase [Chitinispirillia bacterium]|jgi:glucuronate isomerase